MDYYTSFLLRHVDSTLECMANALREVEKTTAPIDKKWWEQEYRLHRTSLCKLVDFIEADKILHR